MAKSKSEVVAFNAGELGKEALARVDLQNYPRGAEIMENIFPLVQGGMTKMPGTRFIASTPSNGAARLRPFIFSETARFEIELSEQKLRLSYEDGMVLTPSAAATLGTWTDESAVASSGGGTPPSGGGDVSPGDYGGAYGGGYTGGAGDGGGSPPFTAEP